ncbi:hypothetical protein IG631_20704 [Alternaria alternata]|nr:hypothetical protein IG631_20704 [Alternaria alternata]
MEGFGQLLPARCFRELQPTHGLCDFAGDLELPNMTATACLNTAYSDNCCFGLTGDTARSNQHNKGQRACTRQSFMHSVYRP